MQNYELELPPRYTEIACVCFDDVKTGFWYDMKAVLPAILLSIIGWIHVKPTISQTLITLGILAVSIYPYFSLHEIIHGMVVKITTGQHVEIGFNKSGAYCGMPDLYMYRTLAICCTAAPLVVFSLLFGLGAITLIIRGHWLFFSFALLLILHLLGCRSDVNLLKELGKNNKQSLLVKDAGSKQWFYLPDAEQ